MKYALLTLIAFSFACGGKTPKRYKPEVKIDPIPLMIWVEPTSDLPEEDVLKACEEWGVMGIQCHLVPSQAHADIRVFSDTEDPCARNKKGRRTLARAWRGGKVVFYRKCFGNLQLTSNNLMFRSIGTHEVGHQLGIWDHVPESCDSKKVKKHSDGKKICGKAVMNPLYSPEVHFVTPVDKRAFDIRDRFIGVVVDETSSDSGEPDCVYQGE